MTAWLLAGPAFAGAAVLLALEFRRELRSLRDRVLDMLAGLRGKLGE